jgi:hypothetical protein
MPGEHHARFDRIGNDFIRAAFEQAFEVPVIAGPDDHRNFTVQGSRGQRDVLAGLYFSERYDQNASAFDSGVTQDIGIAAVTEENRFAGLARIVDDIGFD